MGDMDTMRQTMRALQSDTEVALDKVRSQDVLCMVVNALTVARKDELVKLQKQIARSTQQAAEHVEAQCRVRDELTRAAGSFQAALTAEAEGCNAIRVEVVQLRQVLKDFEQRIEAKNLEIESIRRANSEQQACTINAERRWRRELGVCMAPLSAHAVTECIRLLGQGGARGGSSGAASPGSAPSRSSPSSATPPHLEAEGAVPAEGIRLPPSSTTSDADGAVLAKLRQGAAALSADAPNDDDQRDDEATRDRLQCRETLRAMLKRREAAICRLQQRIEFLSRRGQQTYDQKEFTSDAGAARSYHLASGAEG